jgi:hypothetical protein
LREKGIFGKIVELLFELHKNRKKIKVSASKLTHSDLNFPKKLVSFQVPDTRKMAFKKVFELIKRTLS